MTRLPQFDYLYDNFTGTLSPQQMAALQKAYALPAPKRVSESERKANLAALNSRLEAEGKALGEAFAANTQDQPIEAQYRAYQHTFDALKNKYPHLSEEQVGTLLDAFSKQADVFAKADKEAGFFARTGDALTYVPSTLTKFGEQLSGLFSPDGAARQWFKDATEEVESWRSDEAKLRSLIAADNMAAAKARGETGFTQFFANAVDNPIETLGQFTESALPTVGAAVVGTAAAPVTGGASLALPFVVGGIQGAGETRNTIYDHIMTLPDAQLRQSPQYQALLAGGLNADQARQALASSVIEHGGEVLATGLSSAALSGLGGLGRLGQAGKGIMGTAAGKFGSELATETLDETFQQFMGNKAIHDIDPTHSLTDSLGEAAAGGLLFGAAGGGVAALDHAWRSGEPSAKEPDIAGLLPPPNADQATQPAGTQPTQPAQPAAKTAVDPTALATVLSSITDPQERETLRNDLIQDIQDGEIGEQAIRPSLYGRLAQAYLQATGQVTEQTTVQPTESAVEKTAENPTALAMPQTAIKGGSTALQLGSQGNRPADYELVEADELQVNLTPNAYQNRDRTAADSQMQIRDYARHLNPAYLGASPDVTQGAPTVDGNYGVFAGNGRLAAIKQAYERYPHNAAAYKAHLAANAAQFGFTAEQVAALQKPVLVRKVNDPIDVAQAVADGNFNTGLDKGVMGNAAENAAYLTDTMLQELQLNDDGSLNLSGKNTPFIQALVATIPVEHRPRFFAETKIGTQNAYTLTEQGKTLVENALLVKAYSDNTDYGKQLLTDLISSTDEVNQRVKKALIAVAGKVIAIRHNTDFNVAEDITQAYGLMRAGKQQGLTEEDAVAQQDFVNPPSKFVTGLTRLFYNPKNVAAVQQPLTRYLDSVIHSHLADTQQDSMFGDELAVSKEQLWEEAGLRYSQSAMKSVEANIKRGREAMHKAITEQRTVHRAMFNHELGGWVDFEWGDSGRLLPSGKTKGAMGIAHIIESRMRKDNMSYADVTKMLTTRVVETIAKGNVSKIYESGKVKSVFIDYAGNRATLIKREGSNSWLMNAFELQSTDEQVGSNDPNLPTHTLPTRQRQDVGAVGADTLPQSAPQGNSQAAQDQQSLSRILGEDIARHIQVVDANTTVPTGRDVRRLAANGVEGWFDIRANKLFIISENIEPTAALSREERLAWVAWHELAHAGMRVKFAPMFNRVLLQAGRNTVVKVIARKIGAKFGYDHRIAVEEAMVEIYAAAETGNWAELESRYGMKIHESWRQGKNSVGDFLTKLANLFRRIIGAVIGKDLTQTLTTAQVFDTLRGIQQGIMGINRADTGNLDPAELDMLFSRYADTADKIARAFKSIGLDTQRDSSRISQSEYLTVFLSENENENENGEREQVKIRLSNHALPGYYTQADYEVNVGDGSRHADENWEDVVKKIVAEHNLPMPAVLKRNATAKQNREAKQRQTYLTKQIQRLQDSLSRLDTIAQDDQYGYSRSVSKKTERWTTDPELHYVGSLQDDDSKVPATKQAYLDKYRTLAEAELATLQAELNSEDIRYSLKENADSEFAKAVDDFIEGNEVKTSISLGTTPDVLKMIGLPDVEVKIKRKVLSKVMRGKHAIEPEALKQLPQQMNDPVGVLKSSQNASNPNGYVVLTELTEYNAEKGVDEPVIAALHLTQSGEVEILGVASAYGKDHSKLQEMLNEDEVLYWHKAKGSQLANVHWLQLPLKLRSNANLSRANIKTETDLSQYQSSQSAVENAVISRQVYDQAVKNGKTELTFEQYKQVRSPEFKRWFGDWENDPENASKVINPKTGEPLVVYHGSANYGFNTFNQKNQGIYFSSEKAIAESYKQDGDIYGVFLNAKKIDEINFNGAKWDKYISPENQTTGDFIVVDQYDEFQARFSDKNEAKKYAELNSDIDEDFLLTAYHIDDVPNVIDLPTGKPAYTTTEALSVAAHSRGKDGVIFHHMRDSLNDEDNLISDVYVVFKSNQIKSATDNVGSFDESNNDIRYSIKQSVVDLARSGKAQTEPTAFDNLKAKDYDGFMKRVNKLIGKVDEWVTDGLRPVNDWIDGLKDNGITAHEAERLKDDMYRAKGVRDALNAELEQAYLKPLIRKIAEIAGFDKIFIIKIFDGLQGFFRFLGVLNAVKGLPLV